MEIVGEKRAGCETIMGHTQLPNDFRRWMMLTDMYWDSKRRRVHDSKQWEE